MEEDIQKADRNLKKALEVSSLPDEAFEETRVSPVQKTAPKAPLPLVTSAETGGTGIPDALKKSLEDQKKKLLKKFDQKTVTIEGFFQIADIFKDKESRSTPEYKQALQKWPRLAQVYPE